MLSKKWKINAVYRDAVSSAVTMIDFECEYTHTQFAGQKSTHIGKVHPIVQPSGTDVADYIAALEATFAPQQFHLDQHHHDFLAFHHLEAVSEKTIITPVVEPLRPLTARELRLTLIHYGISTASVDAYISAISDQQEREIALTEWEYATSFARDHDLIDRLATHLSLAPSQVDAMWRYGMALTYVKAAVAA